MRGQETLKILTFSTLFPNMEQPAHGIFVWRRLREVLATGRVETRVVAPVPWFPFSNPRFGAYARVASVPYDEVWEGVTVVHPRYVVIPKVGMHLSPFALAAGAFTAVRRLMRDGFNFDVIDAHYYYPDGVAASLIGQWLKKPVVITARGTDINLIPRDALARRMILRASARAQESVAVCQALKDEMVAMGMDECRIRVLRNGVDLERFQPIDRRDARRQLGIVDGRWLLSVGHLIERKGHDIPIKALPGLPGWSLVIAGEGPLRAELESLARDCGVADRVHFSGLVPAARLPLYYSAVDALVLASSREGWANVLLESMACGTPVVASAVWGTPEVVASRSAGVLMQQRTPESMCNALAMLMSDYPSPEQTRRYAEQFGWQPTTDGQLELFGRLARTAA